MNLELVIRFDYGSILPWVRRSDSGIRAIAGPDMISLRTPVPLRGENFKTVAEFSVKEGDRVPFDLTWYPSQHDEPPPLNVDDAILDTEAWWQEWSGTCSYQGEWRDAVLRSLITLKALTFRPTGGIVAAATTSLPEALGGVRNWDYRFCWVRDATLTLNALLNAGYREEAREWREWLVRAVAGSPSALNIVYGLRGERRLPELELPWLSGYEGSVPVRVGNAAYSQFQLDIFGEVADTLYQCRLAKLAPPENEGEMWPGRCLISLRRDGSAPITAFGRCAARSVFRSFQDDGLGGGRSRHQIGGTGMVFGRRFPIRPSEPDSPASLSRGFDPKLNSFVQFYGSEHLDASLLMMPLVGFLPVDDPRVTGTVKAIETRLMDRGFVDRYSQDPQVDGLPHGENKFWPVRFGWRTTMLCRVAIRTRCNCLSAYCISETMSGLLSEEYDPVEGRLLGNFPQAFSHVGLVNTAFNLRRISTGDKPVFRNARVEK